MATKLNLADITKELNANAGKILEQSSKVRKNLDMVMQSLQKKRSAFIKLENDALEKKGSRSRRRWSVSTPRHGSWWMTTSSCPM